MIQFLTCNDIYSSSEMLVLSKFSSSFTIDISPVNIEKITKTAIGNVSIARIGNIAVNPIISIQGK